MRTSKKPGTEKAKSRKLKLKRQTIGDLDAKAKGKNIKGGLRRTDLYTCGVTCSCITCYITCVCAKA